MHRDDSGCSAPLCALGCKPGTRVSIAPGSGFHWRSPRPIVSAQSHPFAAPRVAFTLSQSACSTSNTQTSLGFPHWQGLTQPLGSTLLVNGWAPNVAVVAQLGRGAFPPFHYHATMALLKSNLTFGLAVSSVTWATLFQSDLADRSERKTECSAMPNIRYNVHSTDTESSAQSHTIAPSTAVAPSQPTTAD